MQENFNKDDLKIEILDTSRQITKKFFGLYYEFCDKHILQKMLNNPKFGPPKDLEELINTWNDFGVPDALFVLLDALFAQTIKFIQVN